MTKRRGPRRIIVNTAHPACPHAHDAEIERLWRRLRKLIAERASDWLRDKAIERTYSAATRKRMSESAKRVWVAAGPEARAQRNALMNASKARKREARAAA